MAGHEFDEYLASDLIDLIGEGEIDRLIAYVRSSGRGDLTDFDGKDGLMYATEARSPELFAALLAAGARVDHRDDDQATALHYVARSGDPDLARLLVEAGADVEAMAPGLGMGLDKEGEVAVSPLLMAGVMKRRDVFDYLAPLTSGRERARVDRILGRLSGTGDRRAASLARAAANGKVEVVRKLLGEGVGPDVLNGKGETPLVSAAMMDHPEVVALLLEAGADVGLMTDQGDRAIGRARDPRTIRLLAAAGADLDAPEEGRDYIPAHRMTPLMMWAGAGRLDSIEALLALGADVDGPNPVGRTPLMRAAELGRSETIAFLLEAGADPRLVAEDGMTAYWQTLIRGDAEPIRLIVEALGLEGREALNAQGFTPLGQAINCPVNQVAIRAAEILIGAGVDVNARSADGRTPLMLAAGRCLDPVLRALLAAGADRSATLPDGRTALDLVDPHVPRREGTLRILTGDDDES